MDTRPGRCVSPPRSELNRPCLVQSLAYWIRLPRKVVRVSLTGLVASLEGIALVVTSIFLDIVVVMSITQT